MNRSRVLAVTWRHIYTFRHNVDKAVDMFYWPTIDLVMWGLTSKYILGMVNDIPNIVKILISGLVFWQVVWRSQYEVTVNLLEEIWSQNVVNLFSTPLKVMDWVGGVVVVSLVKMVVTIVTLFGLSFLMYNVSMFELGLLLLPFVVILLMGGWWIGFFVAGLIIRYGRKVQPLAWSGVYMLAPFSAIYYSVDVLPVWAQKISAWVPLSYVFEGMRSVIATGTMNVESLYRSSVLTALYLVLSLLFFRMMFGLSRKKGLSSLE